MRKIKKSKPDEPSQATLREIPEIDFSTSRSRRNPNAARIANEGIIVKFGSVRPPNRLEVWGKRPRSVRYPDAVWKRIEARATAKGITVHAALREAILAWLRDAA
jgi:hypothetical protein